MVVYFSLFLRGESDAYPPPHFPHDSCRKVQENNALLSTYHRRVFSNVQILWINLLPTQEKSLTPKHDATSISRRGGPHRFIGVVPQRITFLSIGEIGHCDLGRGGAERSECPP